MKTRIILFIATLFFFCCVQKENNVSNILRSLGSINSITIISLKNHSIRNDTIYHTKSTNEINYFKSLFASSGHENSEGKILQMPSTHADGHIIFGYEQKKTFDIYYDGECCYWLHYKNNLVWSLFSKRLSEFIGGQYETNKQKQAPAANISL